VIGATVSLRCKDSEGAGFFIEPDLVVTNAHVLCEASRYVDVTFESGLTARGRRVGRNTWYDYALVEVTGAAATPIPIGDPTILERGDPVYLAGSPRGMDFTFSQGIVSHPERYAGGIWYLQIDASINPGNSGGALTNAKGEVVGLVSMMVGEGSDLGLALPVTYILDARHFRGSELSERLEADAWQDRLRTAEERNRSDVEAFRSRRGTIDLVDVEFTMRGTFEAVVVQWNDERPESTPLVFSVVEETATLCRPSATVRKWKRANVDEVLAGVSPRFGMWLERNDLAYGLYVGRAALKMRGCPDPTTVLRAEIELESGGRIDSSWASDWE
jgi:hypothetical protein